MRVVYLVKICFVNAKNVVSTATLIVPSVAEFGMIFFVVKEAWNMIEQRFKASFHRLSRDSSGIIILPHHAVADPKFNTEGHKLMVL